MVKAVKVSTLVDTFTWRGLPSLQLQTALWQHDSRARDGCALHRKWRCSSRTKCPTAGQTGGMGTWTLCPSRNESGRIGPASFAQHRSLVSFPIPPVMPQGYLIEYRNFCSGWSKIRKTVHHLKGFCCLFSNNEAFFKVSQKKGGQQSNLYCQSLPGVSCRRSSIDAFKDWCPLVGGFDGE